MYHADEYVEAINARSKALHIVVFNYFVQQLHYRLSGFHLPTDQFSFFIRDLYELPQGLVQADETTCLYCVPEWQKIVHNLNQYFTDKGFDCDLKFCSGGDPMIRVCFPRPTTPSQGN